MEVVNETSSVLSRYTVFRMENDTKTNVPVKSSPPVTEMYGTAVLNTSLTVLGH